MKKLFLMMGLASLFMVACNNAPKQEQPKEEPQQEVAVAEEHHCPFCTLKAEYANWDNMAEADRVELNNRAIALFAEMDAKMAECEAKKAECEANGEAKPCCKEGEEHKCQHEMPELTEEQKAECEAKCAEMKAKMDAVMEKWANIDALTNDEIKDLVLERIAAMGMGEGKCDHHEGEAHECNHEGEGHQCQHGEGHQCDHAK
ncbi:MAG: hypothetical protein K5920_02325 [Bacteroidales bacterium]|nr:hypothetical protein [Bacteroidales bacterium]